MIGGLFGFRATGGSASAEEVTELPPYAQLLGIEAAVGDGGETLFRMPFGDAVLGRPGYLHGGAIAGLLEFAALRALTEAIGGGVDFKPINVTVSFLRGGIDHDTFAAAKVRRLGKRVGHVEALAWQEARDRPIASATMNIRLRPADQLAGDKVPR